MTDTDRTAATRGRDVEPAPQRVGDDLKREGKRLISDAKGSVADLARDRKDATASYVRVLASAVGAAARKLEDEGHEGAATLARRAADETDNFAQRIAAKDAETLLRELQRFASQRPALFFGAAFMAAFGAARFLKSSARRDWDEGRSDSDTSRPAAKSPEPVRSAGSAQSPAGRTAQGDLQHRGV